MWTALVWFRVRYSGRLLHKYGKGSMGSIQRGVLEYLTTRTLLHGVRWVCRSVHYYSGPLPDYFCCFNNNNNNNIYLLQLGCHPVALVILHVYKT